jgi:hypothetical protein
MELSTQELKYVFLEELESVSMCMPVSRECMGTGV